MAKRTGKKRKGGKIHYDKLQRAAAVAASGRDGNRQQRVAAATPPRPAHGFNRLDADTATPSTVIGLQPLAPIIVRSGRPFDAVTGVDAARFPPPSTLAGCLRTACADHSGEAYGLQLADISVAGPLLIRTPAGQPPQWLVPKPADATYFHVDNTLRCLRAAPTAWPAGAGGDLPAGLAPVMLQQAVEGKAAAGPQWWGWDDLLAFRSGAALTVEQLQRGGWTPPSGDRRTHVAIDRQTGAAEAARLYQTEGLDLESDNAALTGGNTAELQFLARCGRALPAGLVHLGGERRLARVTPLAESAWPAPPADWWTRCIASGGLTLTLLTPALFTEGFRPAWLDANLCGAPPTAPDLRLQLVAAAVERSEPHSGWDLARQAPRATRRLAPAGAVYWFKLLDTPNAAQLAQLWLASISDCARDRCDGYGLALPAPWTPCV